MTLLDLIRKNTKVTNLDDGTVLFETGFNQDNNFMYNLDQIIKKRYDYDELYVDDIDFDIDDLMSSDDYLLCKQIIHAAWLTYKSIGLITAITREDENEIEEQYPYVPLERYHIYEVCIGDDFKTEIGCDIYFSFLESLNNESVENHQLYM